MRLVYIVVALLLGGLAVASSVAVATDNSPKTLADCARLLPPGYTYSYQASGTIDTTSGKPVLSGTFTVDDGTKTDKRDEGGAFAKCVANLIGA